MESTIVVPTWNYYADVYLYCGASVAPAAFFHSVMSVTNNLHKKRLSIRLAYGISALFLCLNLFYRQCFVASVDRRLDYRFISEPGMMWYGFLIFFCIFSFWGLYILYRFTYSAEIQQKNRFMYLSAAYTTVVLSAFFYLLLVHDIKTVPVDNLLVVIYALLFAYAITRHRLMDVKIFVRKGIVYSILTAILSGLYVSFILVSGLLIKHVSGINVIWLIFPAVFLLAILFQPIKDKIQQKVDQMLFPEKAAFRKSVRDLSGDIATLFGLEMINEFTANTLRQKLKIRDSRLILHSNESQETALPLALVLNSKNGSLGTLSIGEKISREPFSDDEIDILQTFANQLAIAIENTSLHEKILSDQKQLLLADKLSSLGKLAAGLAHEIKNPLAAIKGMTQALDRNINNQEYLRDLGEVVPKELDRISQLVDNLLSLAKTKELNISSVSLNDLLEGLLKLHERAFADRKITVCKKLLQVPVIQADSNQLHQVFTNILLNSLSAMPSGGQLSIASQVIAGKVIVTISDNGEGIPSGKLKSIFEPFFSTKQDGLGLGLAITHKIIEDHGGTIEVESKEGHGTTVRVSLPTL